MGRISRTITLARASWEVLKADKELILLPIMSLISTIVIAASFLAPILLRGDGAGLEEGRADPITYVLLFVAYVVLFFITIFFNAALVHAANERLEGGDPTVGSALRGAMLRVGRILPWAIVSATVSVILQAIQERGGAIGRIASAIGGLAWTLVTFLVVPILVIEGIGVKDAVTRSASLFKKTWGENVAAQVGFGLLGLLVSLPAVLVAAAAFALGSAVGFVILALAVLWILGASMVISALNGVFQTALYRYATGAGSTGAFDAGELRAAFAPKGTARGFAG
jgi:hypothetical protein